MIFWRPRPTSLCAPEAKPQKPRIIRRLIACASVVGLAILPCGLSVPVAQAEPARMLAQESVLAPGLFGRSLRLRVQLDRAVPFRVFTLDAPRRLVVDFEDLEADDLDAGKIAPAADLASVRIGRIRPGWSRIVLDLARPLGVETAEMQRNGRGALLDVRLHRTSPAAFAAAAGPPPGVWPSQARADARQRVAKGSGDATIALDPGHGGIDPGALRGDILEKDVVLAFALELKAQLLATGRVRVFMTRETDAFVPLADRMRNAREAGADAFVSLHTNALDDAAASGAIAFTLSTTGSSRAAADRALIENRADSLAGLQAAAPTDPVLDVLTEFARARTRVRSDRLARALLSALAPDARPEQALQSADFEVLGAPDMASVLVELGFLSNASDRTRMLSPAWRAQEARAVAAALVSWADEDAVHGALTMK